MKSDRRKDDEMMRLWTHDVARASLYNNRQDAEAARWGQGEYECVEALSGTRYWVIMRMTPSGQKQYALPGAAEEAGRAHRRALTASVHEHLAAAKDAAEELAALDVEGPWATKARTIGVVCEIVEL